jgi:DNA-binding MarR family transcriptional regulator
MSGKVERSLRKMQWDYYMLTQRIARIMEQRLLNRFRAAGHHDMSIARLHTLSIILQERRPTTAQRVAEVMGLSAVTVGRFVRALQEGGWVERRDDPSDGRAFLVEPTEKARAHLHEFLEISDDLLDQAYRGVERAELEQWVKRLESIVETLGKDEEAEARP